MEEAHFRVRCGFKDRIWAFEGNKIIPVKHRLQLVSLWAVLGVFLIFSSDFLSL